VNISVSNVSVHVYSLLCQNWFTNSTCSLCNIDEIVQLLLVKHNYAFLLQFCASGVDCGIEHDSCTAKLFIFFSSFYVILLGVRLYDFRVKQDN